MLIYTSRNSSLYDEHIQVQIQEEFEDTKGAIRIRISKKIRQHNDQKKNHKGTNNDQQNIHIIEKHKPH